MKRFIITLCTAVLFIGCATTYYDSNGTLISKTTMSKLTAEAVKAHLKECRYRIFVDRMYPTYGVPRYLNNDYGVEVSGDSIGLFLPYRGRLYRTPIGSNVLGLYFIQPMLSYKEQPLKDGTRINVITRNKSEIFHITIEQYFNAKTSVSIQASDRSTIRYTGIMSLNDKFVKK